MVLSAGRTEELYCAIRHSMRSSMDLWGYVCQGGSVVLGSSGISSGGVNGGLGITVGQATGLKFYIEARYHYSPQGGRVSTHVLPVTLGVRW